MFLFWDSTYLAYMIPGLLLTLLAQWWVNATYRRWSKVQNTQGLSGAEAAKRLLEFGRARVCWAAGHRRSVDRQL